MLLLSAITDKLVNGHDVAQALEDGKEFDFCPLAPRLEKSSKADKTEKATEDEEFSKTYNVRLKFHIGREDDYRANKLVVKNMLHQQCSDRMKAKLQARKDFLKIKNDPIQLLKAIKQHCLSYESSQCKMQTL